VDGLRIERLARTEEKIPGWSSSSRPAIAPGTWSRRSATWRRSPEREKSRGRWRARRCSEMKLRTWRAAATGL